LGGDRRLLDQLGTNDGQCIFNLNCSSLITG
jgi:hypothetical protein